MIDLPPPLKAESVLPWEGREARIPDPDPTWPTVSIVMPIYQSGAFLERTLRSLVLAGLDGVEVIVMDGGSSDATPEILRHYRPFVATWVSEPDRGQSDAINKGFERASGEILHWLNGDDLLLPGVLPRVRAFFAENPDLRVVSGDAAMTELDLTPIRRFRFADDKLTFPYLLDYAAHHLVQPAVFFRREVWAACGPAQLDLHYAMDAELFLKMARDFGIRHIDLEIAYSVYHEGCKTRKDRGPSIIELAMVQARLGGFDEAERTLKVLSDLLKQAENRLEQQAAAGRSEGDPAECTRCAAAEARASAVEAAAKKNRELLLDLDLRETS